MDDMAALKDMYKKKESSTPKIVNE